MPELSAVKTEEAAQSVKVAAVNITLAYDSEAENEPSGKRVSGDTDFSWDGDEAKMGRIRQCAIDSLDELLRAGNGALSINFVTPLTPRKPLVPPKATMIYLNGRNNPSFRCHCSCNVFTKIGANRYSCNACEEMYEGE